MRLALLFTFILALFNSYAQTYEIEKIELVANVQPIKGLNLPSDDFSPIIHDGTLYFTSSREYNKNNEGENNWEKNGYLNVFQGDIKIYDDYSVNVNRIVLMSNKIKSKTHTGPISFSVTGDTLFFTQVELGKTLSGEKKYLPQLFMAVKKNNNWTQIRKLPFSSPTNTFAHPAYDSKRKRLYFVSDIVGGKGENDIYYSDLVNGVWQPAVNVTSINTASNEKFPYYINDNLFYSSDKEKGKGKLDIYVAILDSLDQESFPIKLNGLNTEFEDFGICITPDMKAGYYTSNKNGNDDIFYFTLERKVTVKNKISGSFTFRKLNARAENLAVKLVDEQGDFVYQGETNSDGEFSFDDIKNPNNLAIILGGDLSEELILELFDDEGNTIANLLLDEKGAFKYKKLFYENSGIISFIPEDMKDFTLNRAKLFGQLFYDEENERPLSNYPIQLLDSSGKVVGTSKTDQFGNFNFIDLDMKQKYFVHIPNKTNDFLFYIYDSREKIFTELKFNNNAKFVYRLIKANTENNLSFIQERSDIFEIDNINISGQFKVKDSNKKTGELEVRAYTSAGKEIGMELSDEEGRFSFTGLPEDEAYMFLAESDDVLELYIVNRYGMVIAKIQSTEDKFFVFKPEGDKSENTVSLLNNEEEFNLDMSNRYEIITVYFDSDQTKVMKNDLGKLRTILELMRDYPTLKLSISAYADATASSDYNMILSEKRATWIAEYLSKYEIDKSRFAINAYGEAFLVDESNDALNRRAELKLFK
ncbi:OmpA family protein [Crocinitomix catalasitica]|uniref:OmpA family protein n=1 Tax=Crocinitomix catalasitica TaxID=184607 RepID=UPI000480E38A|nr:OmpA family protein [Crocinitomix catalasitica]